MARRAHGRWSRSIGILRRRRVRDEAATRLDTVLPCDLAREAISALSDGEEPPVPELVLDAHVVQCERCRGFRSGVASLSRQMRVRAYIAAPDCATEILDALGCSEDTTSFDRECWPRRDHRGPRSLVRATQWAAAIVPLGVAAPALALGAFAHLHYPPSHVPTPCTVSLVTHAMGHR